MNRKLGTLTAALVAIGATVSFGLVPAAGSALSGRIRSPLDPLPPPRPARLHHGAPGAKSPWQAIPTPLDADSMLLLTDGSVIVQELESGNWWRLTPNAKGNYADGTWRQIASMPAGYAPTYYASAVLPDGRVIVEGGEYNAGDEAETTQGAIYDPVANTWTSVSPPGGSDWSSIGDAPSTVLADGTFMLGACCSASDALLNENTLTWTATGSGKADDNSEEGWSLLPDGDVLTVDTNNFTSPESTEIYSPATGDWTSAGNTPVQLVNTRAEEIGPQLLQPNGEVFAAGATGDNAIYNTSTGTWSTGPRFPVIGGQQFDMADGPSAVLPDGDLLLDASSGVYRDPSHFFVWNGTKLTRVADPPDANLQPSFTGRMLVLPSGRILFNDLGSLELYNGGGTPLASAAPQITTVPATLTAGSAYTVSGIQLNGVTQGSAYGDDYQSATNYPLVRITNNATGDESYARTSGMTSMSVAPGAQSSANFTLPAGIGTGPSTLEVIANGIASAPVSVTVDPPARHARSHERAAA
ncbi:MAG TPA: kelch repeat-containing protein [Pseudonocardiaceae bacterium]|nr:kelch repeat-containing protein [Pseudonocardiaceae bacterium]